jgi:hypothetical protein
VAVAETPQAQVLFSDAARSNEVVNPLLRSISRANVPAFQLDPRPAPGSPALTSSRVAPQDGFYKPVAFEGAFSDVNWASGWTALSEYCFLTGAGGRVEVPDPDTQDCTPRTLSIVINGNDVNITFTGEAGAGYRVQSTTDLSGNPINWNNEGALLSGTGTLIHSSSIAGTPKFFRVVCQ